MSHGIMYRIMEKVDNMYSPFSSDVQAQGHRCTCEIVGIIEAVAVVVLVFLLLVVVPAEAVGHLRRQLEVHPLGLTDVLFLRRWDDVQFDGGEVISAYRASVTIES